MSKQPSSATVKALFSRTPRCAFLNCPVQAVDAALNTPLLEICHIKGDKEGAARYDPSQAEDERQGYDNLVLMCGVHHKLIDDNEDEYTVALLAEMKRVAERRAIAFEPNQGLIDHALLVAKVALLEQDLEQRRREEQEEDEYHELRFGLVELHTKAWNLHQSANHVVLSARWSPVSDERQRQLAELKSGVDSLQRVMLSLDGMKARFERGDDYDPSVAVNANAEIDRVQVLFDNITRKQD